jgi:hypothetical protein
MHGVPPSDACFVKAYPRETTEAFRDGHVAPLVFFGRVPLSLLHVNLKIAVAKICGDGKRERARAFTEKACAAAMASAGSEVCDGEPAAVVTTCVATVGTVVPRGIRSKPPFGRRKADRCSGLSRCSARLRHSASRSCARSAACRTRVDAIGPI